MEGKGERDREVLISVPELLSEADTLRRHAYSYHKKAPQVCVCVCLCVCVAGDGGQGLSGCLCVDE